MSKGVNDASGVVINLMDGSRPIRIEGDNLKRFLEQWSTMFEPEYEILCSKGPFTATFEYPYGASNTVSEICFRCSNMDHRSGDLILFDKFSDGGSAIYLTYFSHYPDIFEFDEDFFGYCFYYYLEEKKYGSYLITQLDGFFEKINFNHSEFIDSFNEYHNAGYHEASFLTYNLKRLIAIKKTILSKEDHQNDRLLLKISRWIDVYIERAKIDINGKDELVESHDSWNEDSKEDVRNCLKVFGELEKM